MPERRFSLWIAVFSALILLAGACAGEGEEPSEDGRVYPDSPPAEQDTGPLRLLEWAGYELEDFYAPFVEGFPNAELDYEFADSGEAFFAKVVTGGADVDIAHPCSNWVTTWKDEGLIAPIDVTRLENWNTLDPNMRELGNIDGEYYFVPWDWGYDSLIVATDRVEEVPDSWRDLWDPQYRGRISMIDYAENGIAITAYAWGLDYPNLSDEDLQFVKEKLLELRPSIKTFWQGSTDLVQQLTQGEVDIGYGWNDQYAKVVDAGVEATYIEPEEGRNGWVCGFVVLADTEHYDLALRYIDAAIAPESGAELINQYFLGHSSLEALELADQDLVKQLELDRVDVRERTNFALPLTDQQREQFNQIWSEILAG